MEEVTLDDLQGVVDGALGAQVTDGAEGVPGKEIGVGVKNKGVNPRREADWVEPAGDVEPKQREHGENDEDGVFRVVGIPFAGRDLLSEFAGEVVTDIDGRSHRAYPTAEEPAQNKGEDDGNESDPEGRVKGSACDNGGNRIEGAKLEEKICGHDGFVGIERKNQQKVENEEGKGLDGTSYHPHEATASFGRVFVLVSHTSSL